MSQESVLNNPAPDKAGLKSLWFHVNIVRIQQSPSSESNTPPYARAPHGAGSTAGKSPPVL